MVKSYYIDSCIYLNLWQREKGRIGKPLWKITRDFLKKVEETNSIVYYSGFLLKELSFILTESEFIKKRLTFESTPNFKKIKLTLKEYELAKRIDSKNKTGFYDTIHLLLAKKSDSLLITRDKKLLKLSKKYGISAKRPEEIL